LASSTPETPEAYLESLPADRQESIRQVRQLVLQNLPEGYVETMRWGMLSYEIPLAVFPGTYNGQPLNYVGLAAQKSKNSLYLMGIYLREGDYHALMDAYREAGLRPDVGKSCLRFRQPGDLPLQKIGELIAAISPTEFIAAFQASRKKA